MIKSEARISIAEILDGGFRSSVGWGRNKVLLRHQSWPAIIQGNDDITTTPSGAEAAAVLGIYFVVRIVTTRSTRIFPHLTFLLLLIVQSASSIIVLVGNEYAVCG